MKRDKLWVFAVAVCLSSTAVAEDCPTCTAQERYQQDIKLMKQIARDMRDIDQALDGLSAQAIASIQRLMDDLEDHSMASQVMNIALDKQTKVHRDEEHRKALAMLKTQESIKKLAVQKAEAEAQMRLSEQVDDSSTPLSAAKTSQPKVSKNKLAEDIRKGLFVTFVRESEKPEERAAIILLDNKALSLRLGSRFLYQKHKYQLAGIEPAVDRKDKRKWNVIVRNSTTGQFETLNWAE